jgi:hypothetical protein
LDLFTKYRPPRNYRLWSSPRFIDIYTVASNEEEEKKEAKS